MGGEPVLDGSDLSYRVVGHATLGRVLVHGLLSLVHIDVFSVSGRIPSPVQRAV